MTETWVVIGLVNLWMLMVLMALLGMRVAHDEEDRDPDKAIADIRHRQAIRELKRKQKDDMKALKEDKNWVELR